MQFEVGSVVNGKVTGITEYGAFVELEDGKSGMVHISEVSSGFVKDINEHLKLNQEVKVKIISISDAGKISLSIRKAEPASADKSGKTGREDNRPPRRDDRRASQPKVWQGRKTENKSENASFEDMMASFKKASDEKLSDLKRADSKRGSVGYSRKGKNN